MMSGLYGAFFACSKIWILFSVMMVFPALVSLHEGSGDWVGFFRSSAITFVVGMAVYLSLLGKSLHYTVRMGFLTANLLWLSSVIAASLPFVFSVDNFSYADAFFEAMSGMTTTGSTVLADVESSSSAIVLWRSILQWLGGVGIVILGVLLLPSLRIGGGELLNMESAQKNDIPVPKVRNYIHAIALSYGVISVLCLLSYYFAGMSFFDAGNHMMATVSSGGFSTYNNSFNAFSNEYIPWIGIVFMCISVIPFVMYIKVVNRAQNAFILNEPQVRFFLLSIIIVPIVISILRYNPGQDFMELFKESMFSFVSVVTTTGFFYGSDYTHWGAFYLCIFLCFSFLGACGGSTSGGMKMFRLIIFLQTLKSYLSCRLLKHGVFPVIYAKESVDDDTVRSVVMYIGIYFFTFLLLTTCLAATGLDFITSFSGSIALLSNVGPGFGDLIGPTGNYSSFPDIAKWIASIAMMLGRLEIVTMIAVFSPIFWRD